MLSQITLSESEHIFADESLEISFVNGLISGIRNKKNDSFITAVMPDDLFMVSIREKISPEFVSSYGQPGVQSRKRFPGKDGVNPLHGTEYEFIRCEWQDDTLCAFFRSGDFEFTLSYELINGAVGIEFALLYNGGRKIVINEAGFTLPAFKFEGKSAEEQRLSLYDLRNHTCDLDVPLYGSDMFRQGFDFKPVMPHRMGAMDCDFHHEIDFLISDGNRRFFGWGHEENGVTLSYVYSKTPEGLQYTPCFWCFDRLERGKGFVCGEFFLTFFEADDENLAQVCGDFKRSFDWTVPQIPANISEGCIFQKHSFIADGGGVEKEIKELEMLKDLGISIVYLPPMSPPDAYVNDLAQPLQTCYGTKESLRCYTDAAHKLGMYVICDMILHSFFRNSKIAEGHPEYIRCDELGAKTTYSIGSVTAEITDPGFRQVYLDICRFLVEDCGLDGFRFDVAAFQLPGWNAQVPPRNTVAAQTAVLQMLFEELNKIKPVFFLEEGMGVCGLRYVSHGYIPFLRFLKEADEEILPEILRRLKNLTKYRFLKDRPDVLTMQHLKIHDTVLLQHFGRAVRGGDLALLRYILLSEAVPFITDTCEYGIYDEIRNLLKIRRELIEFAHGSTSFALTNDNERVFAFIREKNDEKSLVCVNFSSKKQHVKISLNCKTDRHDILFCSLASEVVAPFEFELAENGCIAVKISGGGVCPVLTRTEVEKVCFKAEEIVFNLSEEFAPFPEGSFRTSARKEFDEGSFSEVEQKEAMSNTDSVNNWFAVEFDDSKWLNAFHPTLWQPYCEVDHPQNKYIVDTLKWEQNMLWSRSALIRQGEAHFRSHFDLPQLPAKAELAVYSPPMYDFDFAVLNNGDMEQMGASFNAVSVYINGHALVENQKLLPENRIEIPVNLLKEKDNVIAFSAAYGNGGHGGCCSLYLDGKKFELDFKSRPARSAELGKVSCSAGKIVCKRVGKNSFGVISAELPSKCTCILESGDRVFEFAPDREPQRFNCYSGALMPLVRSDEFFDSNQEFVIKCGNLRFKGANGIVGMIFEHSSCMEIVFISEAQEFEVSVEIIS